jgi:hypothetical protein
MWDFLTIEIQEKNTHTKKKKSLTYFKSPKETEKLILSINIMPTKQIFTLSNKSLYIQNNP